MSSKAFFERFGISRTIIPVTKLLIEILYNTFIDDKSQACSLLNSNYVRLDLHDSTFSFYFTNRFFSWMSL